MKKAQHKIVYEQLLASIEDGSFPRDTILPSENELCKKYKITRPTVRQALLRLENEGYIKKHHGKGSFVQPLKKGIGILSIEGTTTSFNNQALMSEIVTKQKIITWPEELEFEINSYEKSLGCIFMERLRSIDNKAVLFETTFITNIGIDGFIDIDMTNESLFNTLKKEYNIKVMGGDQKFWSVVGKTQIAKMLNVTSSTPLIKLHRKIITNKKNLTVYSIIYCNTELYYLKGSF